MEDKKDFPETEASLEKLRGYIDTSTLEDSIETIYSLGSPRPLLGENSVVLRTFGDHFKGINRGQETSFEEVRAYQGTYFDTLKEEERPTEFAEYVDAVINYDKDNSEENRISVLDEVGDILCQRKVVEVRHGENEKYKEVMEIFDSLLGMIKEDLSGRGLNLDDAYRIARIKYACRSHLGEEGYNPKNKALERRLFFEHFKNAS